MKEFKFTRTKFKISVGGSDYDCEYPCNEYVEKFMLNSQKYKDNMEKSSGLQKEFFETVGLPKKAYDELEPWQLHEVSDWILNFKKK